MFNSIKKSGFVMPVGNGAVGKTSLALTLKADVLPSNWQHQLHSIKKTKHLEFEFISDSIQVNGKTFDILQHFLVPPGQKHQGGEIASKSYEEAIDFYRFYIRKLDVVLLSYKITLLESFNDLEFWLESSCQLCDPTTHFILVGTHLDQAADREVTASYVETGGEYVKRVVRGCIPDWKGDCSSLEVSNLNGENIRQLRQLISVGILKSRGDL